MVVQALQQSELCSEVAESAVHDTSAERGHIRALVPWWVLPGSPFRSQPPRDGSWIARKRHVESVELGLPPDGWHHFRNPFTLRIVRLLTTLGGSLRCLRSFRGFRCRLGT